MHILVVNVYFAPYTYGGATIVAEQLARQMVDRHNARVSVISAVSRPELPEYTIIKSETDGIANYLINMPQTRTYAEMYANISVSECIEHLTQSLQPDLVHLHCLQELGADCINVFKRMGLPVVLSIHDFWWICERQFMIRPDGNYCGQDPVQIEGCRGCVDDLNRARFRINYLRAATASADVITYPSKFALDLCERSGIAPGKGVVLKNGVSKPAPDFFERQAARRASDPCIVFGYLGGPTPIKGWPLVRAAFQNIKRDDFRGYLVDATHDGTWYNAVDLDRLKGEWDVLPRFNQRDIDRFYEKIDVLLFLSQWKETFGLAVREALVRGVRVIQTDSGGTTEHQAIDRQKLLKIGDGAPILIREIEAVLDEPGHPEPVDVEFYTDQSDAFMDIVRDLKRSF